MNYEMPRAPAALTANGLKPLSTWISAGSSAAETLQRWAARLSVCPQCQRSQERDRTLVRLPLEASRLLHEQEREGTPEGLTGRARAGRPAPRGGGYCSGERKSTSCSAETRTTSSKSVMSWSRSNSSLSRPAGETQNRQRVGRSELL